MKVKRHIPSTCLDASRKWFSTGIFGINRASGWLWLEIQETHQNGQNVHGFQVRTPICHIVPVSRAYGGGRFLVENPGGGGVSQDGGRGAKKAGRVSAGNWGGAKYSGVPSRDLIKSVLCFGLFSTFFGQTSPHKSQRGKIFPAHPTMPFVRGIRRG